MSGGMSRTVHAAKLALRQQVGERVRALAPGFRAEAAARARALLEQQPVWQGARAILFYAPIPGELDVWPLLVAALAAGKTVGLPRFDRVSGQYGACQVRDLEGDLALGHFGIREPVERCEALALNRLDFILVPGVAFDPHGRRLGRGKGFYDRLLTRVRGATCGVAFDEQVVDAVPVEPHDIVLDCILTPTRWVGRLQRAVLE